MPARGREGQWRHSVAGRNIDFPGGFQQTSDRRRITLVGRPVQRARVVRHLRCGNRGQTDRNRQRDHRGHAETRQPAASAALDA